VIANLTSLTRVVLYEGRDSEPLENSRRLSLLSALLDQGYSVTSVREAGKLPDTGATRLVVLGQFAAEVAPLCCNGGPGVELQVHDITGLEVAEAVAAVTAACDGVAAPTQARWKPWFPVIDYDRCTNCMQCLSFCLFDVYGVTSDGKITVQNESNCKTDCPACSRVCPEVAILFPKYKAGPINGDEIKADDVRREAMKVDISSLLGGDIYSMLRDRSAKAKSRFSKERDDDRALRERQRCLQKLQDDLAEMEIPADVLASLPSADQIQAKADAAKRRAQQALDAAESSTG
jgi:NAD-dependent dihydropyrimidine dehydrogenase PreA subunit